VKHLKDDPRVQSKDANLAPLRAFRLELINERRKAAAEGNRAATLKAQSDVELLDKALADELKAGH
jgi:hypothetical protein